MLNDPASDQWEVEKAVEIQDASSLRGLRQEASRLLARLENGRRMSEERAAETGQRDPMKFITGRSALDSAITATRGMIARMDALLAELEDEIEIVQRESNSGVKAGHNGRGRRAAAFAGSVR